MKVKIKLKPRNGVVKFPCLMACLDGDLDTVVEFVAEREARYIVRMGKLFVGEVDGGWISCHNEDTWQPCDVKLKHKQ